MNTEALPCPSPSALQPIVLSAVASHFGDAVVTLRAEPPLDALEVREWAVLVWLTHAWTFDRRRPVLADVAARSGLSERTVRRSLRGLHRAGVVRSVRVDTATVVDAGPALTPILEAFARAHAPGAPAANLADPAGPARSFVNKKKREEDLPSCSKGDPPRPPRPDAPAVDAATSRQLAVAALEELHRRAYPGLPSPRACSDSDVRLVEACAAEWTGDAATLAEAHGDAIAGAFERSRTGAPTPRFIWGQPRFFLAHARAGRALRTSAPPSTRRAHRLETDDPPAPLDVVARIATQAVAALDRLPDRADRERRPTFASTPRPHHGESHAQPHR